VKFQSVRPRFGQPLSIVLPQTSTQRLILLKIPLDVEP
jgi:hypothetical protein